MEGWRKWNWKQKYGNGPPAYVCPFWQSQKDGTDYGEVERSLDEKVAELQRQIDRGDLLVLYDGDSEEWDLAYKADAGVFMDSGR